MGTTDNLLGLSPDQANSLMNFGFGSMAAGQTPGINTLAALGQGGLKMNEAAQQRAQTQYIQSEAQKNQLQNQMFPYQLQMAKIKAQAAQGILDDNGESSANKPSNAGPSISLAPGSSPPNTIQRPVNNPGNLRPQGQNTGFQQFPTPEEGANGMTGDLVTKISGKSPAMISQYGKGYQPTLANIIPVYAPKSDNNDPLAYTQFVSDKSGIPPRKILTVDDIPAVQAAMTQFEGNAPQRNAGQGLNANTQTLQNAQSPDASEAQYNKLQKRASILGLTGDTEGAKIAEQQATQTPYYQTLQEEIKGTQQRKLAAYNQDLKTDQTWSDSLPGLQESEQRLLTMAKAFKATETGTGASNIANVLGTLKAMGVELPKNRQDSISNIQLGLHEQGIDALQELKSIVQGAGGRILNSEFQNMKNFFTGPNIQPEANQQMLSEALGINHAHQAFVGDWTKAGGMNNTLNNGKPLRTTDFQNNWYAEHKIGDYVNEAKKQIGPLAGMKADTSTGANGTITHMWTPDKGITPLLGAPQ